MVLLLVMIAAAAAMILSLSFLAVQSTSVGAAQNVSSHARARGIAESALHLGMGEVYANVDWRTDYTNGVWVTNESFAGGTFTLSGEDGEDTDGDGDVDGDGLLANDKRGLLTLTAVGTYLGVNHRVSSVVYPPRRVLMVVPNAASLTAGQETRRQLLKGWGAVVSLISHTATQAEFNAYWDDPDAAPPNVFAVYIVNDVLDTSLGAKLTSSPLGVVMEARDTNEVVDDLGAGDDVTLSNGTTINIDTNAHYITSPFANGWLTICSSSQPRSIIPATWFDEVKNPSHTAHVLGRNAPSSSPSLVAYEAGTALQPTGAITNGTTAAARRVMLPWGGPAFNINALNADGQEIMRRSVSWVMDGGPAAMCGTPDFVGVQERPGDDWQVAFQITVPEAGTLTGIRVMVKGPDKRVRFGLYTQSGGNPDQLVCQSAVEEPGVAAGAFEPFVVSMPPTDIAAGTYWAAFGLGSTGMKFKIKDDGLGQVRYRLNKPIVPPGFLTSWGVSDSSETWTVSGFANVVPYADRGPSTETAETVTNVRWVERPE